MELVYIAVVVAFFGVSFGLVRAFDLLRGGGDR